MDGLELSVRYGCLGDSGQGVVVGEGDEVVDQVLNEFVRRWDE